jgi:uncharacterized membrane protein
MGKGARMEFIFGLFFMVLALMLAAVPIAALVLALVSYSRTSRLERRIEELSAALRAAREEGAFQRGSTRVEAPDPVRETPEAPDIPEAPAQAEIRDETPEAPTPAPSPTPSRHAAARRPPPIVASAPPGPSTGSRVPRLSLETVGVWAASGLGGFILLVAGFLAFKLAIDRGWLGPEIRFAGGLAFGALCMVLAELLWAKRYRLPAAGVGGAGLGILYAALYAGHAWYELLSSGPTFGLMVGVTAVGVLQAVRRDSQFVAILGLLGGYLTPVLLSTGENRALTLFSYIGLLLAGLLVAATKRRWWTTVALAGPATAAMLLGWGLRYLGADQAPMALSVAAVLGGMLWLTAWLRGTPRAVAWAAAAGSLLVHLAALPYLMPLKLGEGVDPGAVGSLVRAHPWLAASFLLLVAGALQALATRRRWPVLAVVGPVSLLPGLALYALSWLEGVKPAPEWRDFGPLQQGLGELYGLTALPSGLVPGLLLGAVAAAWVAARWVPTPPPAEATTKARPLPWSASHGAAVMTLVATLVMTMVAFQLERPFELVLLSAGLSLAGFAIAARPGPRWLPLGVLVLVAFTLHTAILGEQAGLLLAGAAVVLVYLLCPFAMAALPGGRELTRSPLPWLASALAGPLLFLPMHEGWEQALTADAIGLLPLALGAGTLAAAVMLRERAAEVDPRTRAVFVGVALLFACLAVPVQLHNEWWTVGWALEAAALAWLSRRMKHPGVVLLSAVLALTVTVRLVLNPEVLGYHPAGDGSLLNWTLYGYGVPLLALLASAFWLRPMAEPDPRLPGRWSWLRLAQPAAVLMAVMVAFMLINLEVSAAFPQGEKLHLWSTGLEASMTRSISWGLFGLLLMLPGQRQELRYLRPVALLLLLMAALKVFGLDLWQLSGLVRVGSLFGVAVSLILAALAFQRLVLRDADRDRKDPKERP